MNQISSKDQIFILAATNQIEALDRACIRRFQRKIKVQPPDTDARKNIIISSFQEHDTDMSEHDFFLIASELIDYSGSDIEDLCREVAMRPISELFQMLGNGFPPNNPRKICVQDFKEVLKNFRKSSFYCDSNEEKEIINEG
jgi:SpoVK/Ycf46/Vps4 family AAA+-type ATPase